MTCDVCGKELENGWFYRVTVSDEPEASAVTCYRQVCGRKAFAIAQMRFYQKGDRRRAEEARLSKWGVA